MLTRILCRMYFVTKLLNFVLHIIVVSCQFQKYMFYICLPEKKEATYVQRWRKAIEIARNLRLNK
jgi:hypothetical protein